MMAKRVGQPSLTQPVRLVRDRRNLDGTVRDGHSCQPIRVGYQQAEGSPPKGPHARAPPGPPMDNLRCHRVIELRSVADCSAWSWPGLARIAYASPSRSRMTTTDSNHASLTAKAELVSATDEISLNSGLSHTKVVFTGNGQPPGGRMGDMDQEDSQLSVSDHSQLASLEQYLRLAMPEVCVTRSTGGPGAGQLGVLDVLTIVAGSSVLTAMVRTLPEFIKSRKSSVSITMTVKGKPLEMTAANVDDVMPILLKLLDEQPE